MLYRAVQCTHVEHVCTVEFGDWFYCLLLCVQVHIVYIAHIVHTAQALEGSPAHLCIVHCARSVQAGLSHVEHVFFCWRLVLLMCTLCTLRTLCALQGFEGSPLHCALCIVPNLLPPRRKAPLRGK